MSRRARRFATRRPPLLAVLGAGWLLVGLTPAVAEVVAIEIATRDEVAGGRSYGLAGAYERLSGRVYFEVDPELPANRIIADLSKVSTNASGRVEFAADFYLLKPQRAGAGNGVVLMDVLNRGRKRILYYFNDAPLGNVPLTEPELGDGMLLNDGYTLLWIGWQFDVPRERDLMRLYAPLATQEGRPIEGLVRSDFVVDETVFDHSLGDRGHMAYGVANPADPRNVLTVRERPDDPRRTIPRELWQFGRYDDGRMVPDPTRVFLLGGFKPGLIYEVVYVAEHPPVAGLGFAALRDTASFLKYGSPSAWSIPGGAIRSTVAFGDSQGGRALRTFIHDGFNADEQGRKAFDGIMVHLGAGARGSFNHRFAQPSRAVDRNYQYPNDLFPYSDTVQRDPLTGHEASLLNRTPESALPKIFFTNSSTEYWRLPAALIHTSVDGSRDVLPSDHSRIYLFAGTQHMPASLPQGRPQGIVTGNPNDYRWFLRALLEAMRRWIDSGAMPPPSRYPSLASASLAPLESFAFPELPGLAAPLSVARGQRLDYGPELANAGVITIEPPRVLADLPFLVPRVDEDGNEIAGLRSPELSVPLATHTGWSPASPTSTAGMYFPFAQTRAERAANDTRPSVEERYASRSHYLGRVAVAAIELAQAGYLRDEDVAAILRRASRHWQMLVVDDERPLYE